LSKICSSLQRGALDPLRRGTANWANATSGTTGITRKSEGWTMKVEAVPDNLSFVLQP
jgi:hypothetical protein